MTQQLLQTSTIARVTYEIVKYNEEKDAGLNHLYLDCVNVSTSNEEKDSHDDCLHPVCLFSFLSTLNMTFSVQMNGLVRRKRIPIKIKVDPPPPSYIRDASASPTKRLKPV